MLNTTTTELPGATVTTSTGRTTLAFTADTTDAQYDRAYTLVPSDAVLVDQYPLGESDVWVFEW